MNLRCLRQMRAAVSAAIPVKAALRTVTLVNRDITTLDSAAVIQQSYQRETAERPFRLLRYAFSVSPAI